MFRNRQFHCVYSLWRYLQYSSDCRNSQICREDCHGAWIRSTDSARKRSPLILSTSIQKADGIISTKALLIKRASELDLYTIHRFFVIDSMAYESIFKTMRAGKPDCIEILPALMPKVIQKLCKSSPIPVIAGGMVSEKEDIMALLQAGAVSVSSTNQDTWFI